MKYRINLTALIIFSLIIITFGCAPAKPAASPPAPGVTSTPSPEVTPAPQPQKEYELKYDDGTSEGSCSSGPQFGYLVHFSPPVTPFTISNVKVFASLRGSGYEDQKVELEIWNQDLDVAHYCQRSATEFHHEPDWVMVDIPNITVGDDFYVVFYTNSRREGGVYMYFDSSVINKHSEMAEHGGKTAAWPWQGMPKEKTNWMIRVVGASVDENISVTSSLPAQMTEISPKFQEAISSLDTPEKLSQWMINNIKYESHYEKWKETGVNYIASPEETFNNKVGCCAEFAVFACHVLECHGYDAEILRVAVESDPSKNHVVCVYQSSGSLYTINVGRIKGPYGAYEDIAFDHHKDWSKYDIYHSWEKYQKLGSPDQVVYRE